jgi:hypothetical protein
VHNGEEAISMPAWAIRHAHQLPLQPPGAGEIRIALLVLTAAAFAVTYLSARNGKQSLWAYLLFGSIVAMLVNVFVPHVPATLAFCSYTPGVVTAVCINLPLMNLLAWRAVREQWVAGVKAAAFGVAVPLALGGMIAVLLASTGAT